MCHLIFSLPLLTFESYRGNYEKFHMKLEISYLKIRFDARGIAVYLTALNHPNNPRGNHLLL